LIKEFNPKAKLIASSDYFNDSIMAEYEKYGFSGILKKPYTIEALSKVIEKSMGN